MRLRLVLFRRERRLPPSLLRDPGDRDRDRDRDRDVCCFGGALNTGADATATFPVLLLS